jgi:hypothetical protein
MSESDEFRSSHISVQWLTGCPWSIGWSHIAPYVCRKVWG